MLSNADNQALCSVGPGTLMGDLIRQYWIPALLASELPAPDSAPVRLRLLGENLVAFRDTSGAVGLVAENCPHRGASLFFGRNEEEGLRCVYHGWKFDTTGSCVDMPNEPPESNFKHKVKVTAYPCTERNGLVWTYMGPRQTPPPLPDMEGNMLPEGTYSVWAGMRECNFVQAFEGDIDTSHLGFLHQGSYDPAEATPDTFSYYGIAHRAPKYAVVETDYGTMYGAYRPATDDSYYWRIAHFLFPFWTMPPTNVLGVKIVARAWVPIDDEHTMFFMLTPKLGTVGSTAASAPVRGKPLTFTREAPTQHVWSARPLPPGGEQAQRLPDRPRGAAFRPELHRHRRYSPAGPGRDREHGRDLRPNPRAPGHQRWHDHPYASSTPPGCA